MQRLDFRAMGCQMLAVVDSDEANAIDALAQVPTWFEEWEASLSRFRPESELNQLNAAPDRAVRVSATLWQVLQESLSAARASAGLVTPAVLDAVQAAGYDRSFELLDARESDGAESMLVADWRAIKFDPDAQTVRLPRGVRLDFGGIAKGWAADEAARRLSAYAPALIDAGGDIAVSGAMASGARWPIAVTDPMQPDRDLALLMIGADAVATSGRDYRRWQHNGKAAHHIIDPRTGQPAVTDVLTATVIAPTTRKAEVAAKVALILGSDQGWRWIEARGELAGLLVLEDGQVIRSQRLDDYVWSESIALFENSVLPGLAMSD